MEKRTPQQWTEYLSGEHTPLTLTEYMAGCLCRLLGAQIEQAQALRHLEAMLGAMDDLMARSNAGYAGSAKVREALAEERAKALNGVTDARER